MKATGNDLTRATRRWLSASSLPTGTVLWASQERVSRREAQNSRTLLPKKGFGVLRFCHHIYDLGAGDFSSWQSDRRAGDMKWEPPSASHAIHRKLWVNRKERSRQSWAPKKPLWGWAGAYFYLEPCVGSRLSTQPRFLGQSCWLMPAVQAQLLSSRFHSPKCHSLDAKLPGSPKEMWLSSTAYFAGLPVLWNTYLSKSTTGFRTYSANFFHVSVYLAVGEPAMPCGEVQPSCWVHTASPSHLTAVRPWTSPL